MHPSLGPSDAAATPPGLAAFSLRGLLFDLGDTLYDATVWRRWMLQQIGRLGLYTHYQAFYRVWDRDFLPAVHRGDTTYRRALRKFLRSAGLSVGQIDELVVAVRIRRRELEEGVRPFPGVPATLALLHASGFRLGILTNSSRGEAAIRRRLARMGIEPYFQAILSSADSRRLLPDRACYREGCAALGLRENETAFLGHDPQELQGAIDSGLAAIAFNHEPQAPAAWRLTRFEELRRLPAPAAGATARAG